MKNHTIKGLYELQTPKKNRAIIFSVVNNNDALRYEYFMLVTDRKGNNIIQQINNPITLARESRASIQRISQTSKQYKEYVSKITDYHIDTIRHPIHRDFNYGLTLKNRA
jgi:hypothetical protein